METVEKITQKISELGVRLEDLNEDKNILENELDDVENDIERIENEIYRYEELLKERAFTSTLSPQEAALLLLDEVKDRESLYGQMLIDNQWCICNGYVLVACQDKFEGIGEIPVEKSLKDVWQNQNKATETIDYISSEMPFLVLGGHGVKIKNYFVKLACRILGEPKQIFLQEKNMPIVFETEKGRAIICPIHQY